MDGNRVLHQNPNAHILLTTRAFKEDGTWAPKEKKAYALDEKGERIPLIDPATGLQKLGKRNEKLWKRVTVLANDWNDQSNAEKWRQSWADMCNLYLPPEQRIDNRSFERQNLEQVPTIHEGYVARQMERRGEVSERMELNRVIRRLNYEEERSRNAASDIGRNALRHGGTATRDSFIKGISDAIKRRERKIDEALEERKALYERFERLQKRRADGTTGANGSDVGRTGAEGRTDKFVTRGKETASDIIRMARSAGADARANDVDSRAIVEDSTAGRENRDAERKRQISERESRVKERKRGISR